MKPNDWRMWVIALAAVLHGLCAAASAQEAANEPQPSEWDAIRASLAQANASLRQIELHRLNRTPDEVELVMLLEAGVAATQEAHARATVWLASLGEAGNRQEQQQLAADRLRLKSTVCQAGFLRGELHRATAAALPPDSEAHRAQLAAAIDAFAAMRVEHLDVAWSRLGYIGEARAQRMLGDVKASEALLQTVLKATANSNNDALLALRRLAMLEQIENALSQGAAAALRMIDATRRAPEFRDPGAMGDQLDWIEARALAQVAMAGRGDDERARAAAVARAVERLNAETVVAVAPVAERLRLLAELEAIGGAMQPEQSAAWARWLLATDRVDEALSRLEALAGAHADHRAEYADALRQVGRFVESGEVFVQLARDEVDEDEATRWWRHAGESFLHAMSRGQGEAVRGRVRPAAQQALLRLAGSDAEDVLRRAALQQWIALHPPDTAADAYREQLEAHIELVHGDAYLQLALASGWWLDLQEQHRDGALDDSQASEQAAGLIQDVHLIIDAASEQGQAAIATRARFLRVQVLAHEPLGDRREALAQLERDWDAIAADAAIAQHATAMRIELLMHFGMADQAEALVSQASDAALSATQLLNLAQVMAQRYASESEEGRSQLQRDVRQLADRTLTKVIRDGGDYHGTAQRAAELLLSIESYADAERVLAALLADETVRESPAAFIHATLLRARALRGLGKVDEARRMLDGLVAAMPDAPQAHLARGMLLRELAEADAALAALREARRRAAAGSDLWWNATLELVTLLQAQHQQQAAHEIMRVALALYPTPPSAVLRRRMTETWNAMNPTVPNERESAP